MYTTIRLLAAIAIAITYLDNTNGKKYYHLGMFFFINGDAILHYVRNRMIPDNSMLEQEKIHYSQEQIEHLTTQHFINKVDQHLRIISSIRIITHSKNSQPNVMLIIDIYYDNHPSGTLSFNLHNHEYEDILALAKNIRGNEFILHEVDNLLSGDVVE